MASGMPPPMAADRPRRRPVNAVSSVLLAISLVGAGLLAANQWRELNRSQRFVGAALIASKAADYGDAGIASEQAPVSIAIVDDMIRDSQPEPEELATRLARVSVLLTVPVPVEGSLPGEGSGPGGDEGGGVASPQESTAPGKPESPGKSGQRGAHDKPEKPDKPDHPGKGRDFGGSGKK